MYFDVTMLKMQCRIQMEKIDLRKKSEFSFRIHHHYEYYKNDYENKLYEKKHERKNEMILHYI